MLGLLKITWMLKETFKIILEKLLSSKLPISVSPGHFPNRASPNQTLYGAARFTFPPSKQPVNHLHPDHEWYTTDVYTDYALHFLDEAYRGDAPVFLYLAYNAPHFPLHPRGQDLARYRGKYREPGWDRRRRERFRRLETPGSSTGRGSSATATRRTGSRSPRLSGTSSTSRWRSSRW